MDQIAFEFGDVEAGWVRCRVKVGEITLQASSSYLGRNPILEFVVLAARIHYQAIHAPWGPNGFETVIIQDEPGGLIFKFTPLNLPAVQLVIEESNAIVIDGNENFEYRVRYHGIVDYRSLVENVYEAAWKAVRAQGFVGLMNGWCEHIDPDGDEVVRSALFPLEHFLYLHAVRYHDNHPPTAGSYGWESKVLLSLLQNDKTASEM